MLTAVDARVVAGVANRHMVALEQGPLEKLVLAEGKRWIKVATCRRLASAGMRISMDGRGR